MYSRWDAEARAAWERLGRLCGPELEAPTAPSLAPGGRSRMSSTGNSPHVNSFSEALGIRNPAIVTRRARLRRGAPARTWRRVPLTTNNARVVECQHAGAESPPEEGGRGGAATRRGARLDGRGSPRTGHASHVARCHVSCTVWVWHTPANPANHARQIRRAVDNCPHATEDPDA